MELNDLMTRPHHEKGAELQLVDPNTGELTEVYLMVRGSESDAVLDAIDLEQKERTRAMFTKEDFDQRASDVKVVMAMVMDWRGISHNGKPVKFSESKAKKLFEEAPAIRRQVRNFAGKTQNFRPQPLKE